MHSTFPPCTSQVSWHGEPLLISHFSRGLKPAKAPHVQSRYFLGAEQHHLDTLQHSNPDSHHPRDLVLCDTLPCLRMASYENLVVCMGIPGTAWPAGRHQPGLARPARHVLVCRVSWKVERMEAPTLRLKFPAELRSAGSGAMSLAACPWVPQCSFSVAPRHWRSQAFRPSTPAFRCYFYPPFRAIVFETTRRTSSGEQRFSRQIMPLGLAMTAQGALRETTTCRL